MSLFPESVPALIKMLGNLDVWLADAEAWAEERGFPADTLLDARLFPDMFPLTRQIQSACDSAKFVASRLSDQEAPKHPDEEKTMAELRARVQDTRSYLSGFSAADFEGAAERKLFLPFLRGGYVTGAEYLRGFAMANFYFHLTTAYGILRHNGVKLGKLKFIGHMDVKQPE